MGRIGITIVKRCTFRLSTQEFANTYFYANAGVNPSFNDAGGLITELVNAEKSFHSTLVTFLRARLWSAGGTPQQNVTIREEVLSGTGTEATGTAVDPERAILVMWSAGLDNRGRTVYLRKWYHAIGNFAGVVMSNSVLNQTAGFSVADRATMATEADQVTRIGNAEEWGLVAESGRERDGGAPTVHQFLEHHQFGDQWRG